jgi:hypothetical protein
MKPIPKLLLAATTALILVGCVTVHHWEYRTRTTNQRIGKTVLDQYGKTGWELIQFERIPTDKAGTNYQFEYIFKRPLK